MAVNQTLTLTEVADSINIADNANKVKIVWKSTQTGESFNANTRTAYYWISINGGAETKYSVSYTLPQGTTKTILSKTITVPHKDDGSGTVKVRTWMDTRISVGEVTLSKTINLTVIPRASSVDSLSCATSYFTGKLTYKYTPKSSAFYNRCNISLNLNGEYIRVKSVDLGQKAASQQTATVTFSDDELKIIYEKLPKAQKGILRFTFRTYSDSEYSNQIGDAVYKEVELHIPNDSTTQADVSMNLEPVSELPDAFEGLYVQGKTKVKVTLSAKGKYDADIKSYSIKLNGTTYNSVSSYTSGFLTKAESLTVYGYAKDSREYTGSTSESITVIGYTKPKILNVEAARCDENGDPADNGTYMKIKAKRSYSTVKSGGAQKNFCQIRYRYKLSAASSYSSWTTILAKNSLTSDEVETGALLGGVLSAASSYHVQVQAIDDIGESASTTITVPTDKVYWHRDGARNSFTFGGYVEEDNTFTIAGGVSFKVKSLSGEDVTLSDTGWIDLGIDSGVSVPADEYDFGRMGAGCYYRVINGNHVYVAFNCACEYAGENVQLNATAIPTKYRPERYCYAMLPTGGKAVVRAFVSTAGLIKIGWIQSLSSGEDTKAESVTWVDGYIDYWV